MSDGSPLRVLFVSNDPPGDGAVCRYRCENIADVLRAAGHRADVVYVGASRVSVDHDVVVLHRICANAEGRGFARAARACGAALVYGADDLVFDAGAFPADTPLQGRFRRFAPLHREMLRAADAALVSTDFLARAARDAANDKPVHVVRNFLSNALMRLSGQASTDRPGKSPITLAYLSGSATHDPDLAVIAEPLRDVLTAHPTSELLLVGPVRLPDVLDSISSRVRRHPFVRWQELPALLAVVDINLAPLDLSQGCSHAKSEIKMLEAGAVGVPTIATDGAGFREVGGEAAFLAATPDDWRRLLTSLIEGADVRRCAGERARTYVEAHGTMAAYRNSVAAAFRQIAALPRSRPGHPRVRRVNWPFSAKYALKTGLARIQSTRRA